MTRAISLRFRWSLIVDARLTQPAVSPATISPEAAAAASRPRRGGGVATHRGATATPVWGRAPAAQRAHGRARPPPRVDPGHDRFARHAEPGRARSRGRPRA